MGFSYEQFLDMTWKEFLYYSVGYERRLERQWDITRHLIASNYNSSGFVKKRIKVEDVMKLPHIDKKPKAKLVKMDKNRLNKMLKVLNNE